MFYNYLFYDIKLDVSLIKVTRYLCFMDKNIIQRHELESRLEFDIYLEIDDEFKDYRVYFFTHHKIQIT